MNVLTHPFTNSAVNTDLFQIHTSITNTLSGIAARLNPEGHPLTIEQLCAHPQANGVPTINPQTWADIQKDLATAGPVDWSRHKCYNKIQCMVMVKMHEYLIMARAVGGIDTAAVPTLHGLQKLGSLAIHSSTALAAKYMWLYYVRHLQLTGRPTDWYYGNAAVTGPVKTYLARIYRLSSPALCEANRVTFELAAQTSCDPLDINTVMWIIGQEFAA